MADPHGGAPPRSLLRQPPLNSLYKQKSWSPDLLRDEAWQQRRKAVGKSGRMKRRSKSVTDEDLDELKACIELGFGFDSPEAEFDRKLSDTLPALGLYYAVNNQYKNDAICRSSTSLTASPSSDCGSPSSQSGPPPIFDQDDEDKIEAVGTSGSFFGPSKPINIPITIKNIG